MALLDILGIALRRWYVVVAGLVITLAVVHHIQTRPGVYWARTSVVFLAPTSTANPNAIETTSGGLIQTTGVVARMVNGSRTRPQPVSPRVTLADQGVRDGISVFQPNIGGQWANNYESASLVIDVTGPSESIVRTRTQRAVTRIEHALRTLQDQEGVDRFNRITARPSNDPAQIHYDLGQPHRAEAVALLLGVGLTLTATVSLDGWLARRRRRSTAAASRALPREHATQRA